MYYLYGRYNNVSLKMELSLQIEHCRAKYQTLSNNEYDLYNQNNNNSHIYV